MSSLTSAETDCSWFFDADSGLDPDGFTSPQHGNMTRLRRSPVVGHANAGSPVTPNRVFRHNSFSGRFSVLHFDYHYFFYFFLQHIDKSSLLFTVVVFCCAQTHLLHLVVVPTNTPTESKFTLSDGET